MGELTVFASPMPCSNLRVKHVAVAGSTITDIVALAVPERIRKTGLGVLVTVNGQVVPQDCWPRLRPKSGTLVNVGVVPTDGGGGKNPLASILSIAVLVAAPYLGAALGTSLGLGVMGTGVLTAAQTAFFSGLVTAGVGVLGAMAISALVPPPKAGGLGTVNNPGESPTQFIEGARNQINRFGVVPVCLGTNRMVPPQAALPYTEAAGNKQYVRQLFCWGYGQEILLRDLKIGETLLKDFKGVDIEHRLNGDLHESTEIYSRDVFQDDMSVLLSKAVGYVQRSTQAEVDEAVVDVTFPSGLCQFNSQGTRTAKRVRLELQYALQGESPQDWTPAAEEYKEFSGASIAVPPAVMGMYGGSYNHQRGERYDFVVIEKYSGRIRLIKGGQWANGRPAQDPIVPANCLRIAKLSVVTERIWPAPTATTTFNVADIRNPANFGGVWEDSGSFVPSKSGGNVVVSAGAMAFSDLDFNESTTEALRKSLRVKFPERGSYDLRLRRLTADSESDQVIDTVYLTSIKSVKYQEPVRLAGINGTALHILASDQLNGAVDEFNAIGSGIIPDYDAPSGEWVLRQTSNPASWYLYTLRGLPNARAVSDSQIDFAALEAWHIHCTEQGYSYNRVIDFDTSVEATLQDIATAGCATPARVDGKRSVAVDCIKEDIVQIITPRNSWGYSGEMLYPQLPHALRVTFRNAAKGYVQDERIVYDDGYDENNATVFETMEFMSCTDADLAWKHGRRYLATARLRPETHSFMMDIEHLRANLGDRIVLQHDVPQVGLGNGRIKALLADETQVTGFIIDDVVGIPQNGVFYVRIRKADGQSVYEPFTSAGGYQSSFTFLNPVGIEEGLQAGDLCAFFTAGGELDLIITRIERERDFNARITALNYAPAIFNAEAGEIPAWDSKITTPLEMMRLQPPVLKNQQSDESVMLRNSDGSLLPRAVFTLTNRNSGDIRTIIRIRPTGTGEFVHANVLESTTERVVITGLDDGQLYDVQIRYARAGSGTLSAALEMNGWLFVGASGLPADVTGFAINVSDSTALLKWDAAEDIDFSHYQIRFSGVYSGAGWATAQVLEERVFENRLATIFQPGTYLIKSIDRMGNESETAGVIITYNPGTLKNVIEVLDDAPEWEGAKDNTYAMSGKLRLLDVNSHGYYYFADTFDMGAVYLSFLSSALEAGGVYGPNLFGYEDMFAAEDLFGAGSLDLMGIPDLFGVEDLFGIGEEGWAVRLEARFTDGDPSDSPSDWSAWEILRVGERKFRAAQFRVRLDSLSEGVTPEVSLATVKIDMPDRIERGEDIPVPEEGVYIPFEPAFRNTPAVAVTIQDGAADDRLEITMKTAAGFHVRVWNATTAGYVARSIDYVASGYGRRNT